MILPQDVVIQAELATALGVALRQVRARIGQYELMRGASPSSAQQIAHELDELIQYLDSGRPM